MCKSPIQHITYRGIRCEVKGTCVVCGGHVVHSLPGGPCGQQVRPESYWCSQCGLHGSSHLWQDAWAANSLQGELRTLFAAFEDFKVAVKTEVLRLMGLDKRTKHDRVNYYWREDVDKIVAKLRKMFDL